MTVILFYHKFKKMQTFWSGFCKKCLLGSERESGKRRLGVEITAGEKAMLIKNERQSEFYK